MDLKYKHHINLVGNQLRNATINPLTEAPTSPNEGQVYYDLNQKRFLMYNGTEWVDNIPTIFSSDSHITGSISKTTITVNHSTDSGSKHIPSGGSSNQLLRWDSDGTAVWSGENWFLKANSEATGIDVGFSGSIDITGSGETTITRTGTNIDIYSPTAGNGITVSSNQFTVQPTPTASLTSATMGEIGVSSDGVYVILGTTDKTAYRGDRGESAYLHSLVTSGNPHVVTKAEVGLGNVENKSSATIRSELTFTNVTDGLDYTPINENLIGANNGIAELDSSGIIRSSQLPSFVEDVLEFDTLANFPATGEEGKIYVTLDTNKTYRWSGTDYIEISAGVSLGDTSSTAYRGDRGKVAYDNYVTGFTGGDGNSTVTISRNNTTNLSLDLSHDHGDGIYTDTNYYLTALDFTDGTLTATVNGATNPSVSLDGRYSLIHDHPYDNYDNWTIKDASGDTGATVSSGEDVQILGGTNVTTSRTGRNITINSSFTNTASAENNILEGSNSGTVITYKPYTTNEATSMKFYTHATNPSGTDRLNIGAYFYATRLYDDGKRVSTTDHTHGSYDRDTSVLSGGNVFSDIVISNGIITGSSTRTLDASDVGARSDTWLPPNDHSHTNKTTLDIIDQDLSTTDSPTFVTVTADLSGNASTASKWATARTISLTGSVTGNVDIDGSEDVSISTTTNHTHTNDHTHTNKTVLDNVDDEGSGHIITVTERDKLNNIESEANKYIHPSDGEGSIGTALTDGSVISQLVVNTAGHVTETSTRTLTASDVGARADTWLPSNDHSHSNKANLDIIDQDLASTDSPTFVTVTADLSGNATSADKWSTARNIALTGSVTGNVDIDGSEDVSIATTTNHDHGNSNYDNDYLDSLSFDDTDGVLTATMAGTNSFTTRTVDLDGRYSLDTHDHGSYDRATSVLSGGTVFSDLIITNGIITGSSTRTLDASSVGARSDTWLPPNDHSHSNKTNLDVIDQDLASTDSPTFNTITADLSGNASTASKWATARTISLTGSVTGSVSIDGSEDVSISTTTNHSHNYLPLSGGSMTGAIDMNNNNLTNLNHITINDSGVNEGIEWLGGSGWKIFESPDDLSNASGNLQFVTGSTRRATMETNGDFWIDGDLKITDNIKLSYNSDTESIDFIFS